MAAPITNASALNSDFVQSEVMKEMVYENTLFFLMGSTANSSIQMVSRPKKSGDTVRIPFLNQLNDSATLGSSQLQGNTEDLSYVSDTVTIDYVRYGVKIEDLDLTEERAPFQIFNEARPLLVTAGAQHLRDHIIDELGDVSEGRSRNRYLYGAADANWNATHATALANIDTTADKMTFEIIDEMKEKADLGGNTSGLAVSHRIRPYRQVMDNGAISNMYVLLLHPTAARQLRADPLYQNIALYRNEQNAPKLVDGSRYMGQYNGVLLYQLDELARLADNTAVYNGGYTRTDLTTAGASSSAVVHNLLLGAQAVAVVQGMMPRFDEEATDFKRNREVAFTELRGVEKLVFNSVDNGVLHCFTSKG